MAAGPSVVLAAALASGFTLPADAAAATSAGLANLPAFACARPAYAGPAGEHGRPVKATVQLEGVSATFTALSPRGQSFAGFESVRDPGLTVSVDGRPVRTMAVRPPFGFSTMSGVTTLQPLTGKRSRQICLARFAGARPASAGPASAGPEVAVLVGTFSGGAHCCTWVYANVVAPPRAFLARPVWQNIGNPAVQLKAYAGTTLLVTEDNSFAYTFDSYAASGMPVRVLELREGEFLNTTRHHLAMVAANARFWWAQYRQVSGPKGFEPKGGLGILAPWVADECLLGHAETAWATVDRLQEQGDLAGGTAEWPKGAAYVHALRGFLVKQHYCPPSKPNAST
jgi:hypothetical protein